MMKVVLAVVIACLLSLSIGQDREEAARIAAMRRILKGNNAAAQAINTAAAQANTAFKSIDTAAAQASNAANQAKVAIAQVNGAAVQAANAAAQVNDALMLGALGN